MTAKHEKTIVDFETGEVSTLNNNFVQLYLDQIEIITAMNKENPTAVNVFMWLLKHMDKRNALVVSQLALSEALGVSRRTIQYATAYLREKKAVALFKSGNSNIYAVNAQIAWKSDANGKKYALFDAKVYIAELEQEPDRPLFDTQLIGHAVPKKSRKPARKQTNQHIEDFETSGKKKM